MNVVKQAYLGTYCSDEQILILSLIIAKLLSKRKPLLIPLGSRTISRIRKLNFLRLIYYRSELQVFFRRLHFILNLYRLPCKFKDRPISQLRVDPYLRVHPVSVGPSIKGRVDQHYGFIRIFGLVALYGFIRKLQVTQ